MFGWIRRGLSTGILTTHYPSRPDSMPREYRGRPVIDQERVQNGGGAEAALVCPTGALASSPHGLSLDLGRCIQCGLCAEVCPRAITMVPDFELATRSRRDLIVGVPVQADEETVVPIVRAALGNRVRDLKRSIHFRHVDAGSDGAAEQEIYALTNPYYDIHRLGIFLTPTPRHADILLVTGAMTQAMAEPLRATYEAVPAPRVVIAVGTPACSGGIYRGSYAVLNGIAAVLPVDIFIPGEPPPPLALIYGLLLAVDRIAQRLPQRETGSETAP